MKFFCVFGCVMVGWLAVSGVNDCFLGRFWGFGLLVGCLRRLGCG